MPPLLRLLSPFDWILLYREGELGGVEGVEGGGDQNMVCGAIEKRVWGEVEGVEGVEGDGDQNMFCGA